MFAATAVAAWDVTNWTFGNWLLLALGVIAVVYFFISLLTNAGIIPETEQGVMLVLGKIPRFPVWSIYLLPAGIVKVIREPVRTDVLEIPRQDIFLKGNIPASFGITVRLRLISAPLAYKWAVDYQEAAKSKIIEIVFNTMAQLELKDVQDVTNIKDRLERDLSELLHEHGIRIELSPAGLKLPVSLEAALASAAESEAIMAGMLIRSKKSQGVLAELLEGLKAVYPGASLESLMTAAERLFLALMLDSQTNGSIAQINTPFVGTSRRASDNDTATPAPSPPMAPPTSGS